MEIKAVLFDCDGLMFNTEQVSQQLWRDEAKKYGETLSDDFFKAITGARGVDMTPYEKETPHLKEIAAAMRQKRFDLSFWSSFQKDELNKKGMVELALWLHENGYRIAVCSSSNTEYVETLLSTVSCHLPFDAIIGGNMVKRGKPAPDIFLKGAEILGVRADECLVLEDSRQGIVAAHAAGMVSVFVEDTIAKDEEIAELMTHEVHHLGEVIDLLKGCTYEKLHDSEKTVY